MHAANIGEAAIVDSLLQAGADCSLQSTVSGICLWYCGRFFESLVAPLNVKQTNQTAADLAKTEDIRTSIVAHGMCCLSR